MARPRCVFCRRWYKPYPAQSSRQQTCGRKDCRYRLKAALNRIWERRHDAASREDVNRALRIWAEKFPHYWRHYRRAHCGYVRRDNKRRARALRSKRWGRAQGVAPLARSLAR